MGLAQLGRFAEAAEHEAEAIRLAEPTQHACTVGWAHHAAARSTSSRATGRRPRGKIERWMAAARTGNVVSPASLRRSPPPPGRWRSSARRARRSSRSGRASSSSTAVGARGIVGNRGWAYHALGRASLCARPARRGAEPGRPRDRILAASPGFAAHARHLLGDIATHPEPVRCRGRRGPLPPGSGARRAARHAPPRRPLPPRPRPARSDARGTAGRRREHLTIAVTMYREMDMRFWPAQAQAAR